MYGPEISELLETVELREQIAGARKAAIRTANEASASHLHTAVHPAQHVSRYIEGDASRRRISPLLPLTTNPGHGVEFTSGIPEIPEIGALVTETRDDRTTTCWGCPWMWKNRSRNRIIAEHQQPSFAALAARNSLPPQQQQHANER
jgi:hypothetical protein